MPGDLEPDYEFVRAQYEIASKAVEGEWARYRDLTERGKVYLQILTAMLAGTGVFLRTASTTREAWPVGLVAVLALISQLVAFGFVVSSLGVREYAIPYDEKWEEGQAKKTEELHAHLVSVAKEAFRANMEANATRSQQLARAHPWLLLGCALSLVGLAASIAWTYHEAVTSTATCIVAVVLLVSAMVAAFRVEQANTPQAASEG